MIAVVLYSNENCHLCDIAKEVLTKIQREHPFELREIKIQEGTDEYARFKERIPVVFINGSFAFQFRVPESDFIAKLKVA